MHTIKLSMQIKETHSRKRFKYTMYRNWNMKYAHIIWRADVVLWRSTFIGFSPCLNLHVLVLKMIALSCDCVCCEDGYMYTCEALSHVTLHSKYRTLVTACYKENGGMMKMQGPLTPRPNCWGWMTANAPRTQRPIAGRTLLRNPWWGTKTRLKMLRRCSGS